VSKTKLKLSIAHQVPGRVRLKIPSAKGNPELLRQISDTFGVIPGIEQITVNPTTGSVVLHYDTDQHHEFHGRFHAHVGEVHDYQPPATEIDELARKIEEEAEFLAQNSDTARAFVDFCKRCDNEIKLATGNLVDLKIVLAVAIIAFAVLEIGPAAATPVWVTLTIFALNHFIAMHPHHQQPAGAPVITQA
jgi:hypothetical protein